MTTTMNLETPVNGVNLNEVTEILNGIDNGICTVSCVSSTTSVDAAGDYPAPSSADAKFCSGKKALESSVAIVIFVVSGSFGAINACGDFATCQTSLDDIIA